MKKLLYVSLLTFILSYCENNKQENIYDRDNRLISEYHRKMVKEKGDSTYFIYSYEIASIILKRHIEISNGKIAVGDNACFCDTTGNIRYQAIIKEIKNGKIYIECLDLKKAEYYKTELNSDSVKDLQRGYPYKLRFFR